MRYFMRLAYRGAPFHGWQSQPGEVTVQETLEKALSTVMRRDMKIVGAGRTDTGVNARMMVAHFDTDVPIENTEKLVRGLNSLVGKDIAVYEIYEVSPDKHARFDATSRTYHYYAVAEKSPLFYRLSWKAPAGL
ncbi:MAG: tRNA pseudouridine(38-40) synthase TruA, partial [Duncaniella sp.]|nr:tRNA pseudouridine(38-40) synthase TruA [Duncaniella sp.]